VESLSPDMEFDDTVLVRRRGAGEALLPATVAAVLIEAEEARATGSNTVACDSLAHLDAGDIVLVDGESGRIRTLYRQVSSHNALFVTEDCNSNCLMCSQPPKPGAESLLNICLRTVELLRSQPPAHLGITGGEPTLLGEGFIRLLASLKANLPDTVVTALSNGRGFADAALADAIADVGHPGLRFTIPLHADVPDVHDYIAQAKGAFTETVAGFYNLAARGLDCEVRVVLHAQSVPRLGALAEWIWRKLPFVSQVAFMGLENMGYVRKNWEQLWIDPLDYADDLRKAVKHLYRRGIDVSIYNLPYCVLPPQLWGFARQSISDHKQVLIEECRGCDAAPHCAGLFISGAERHSRGITPLHLSAPF
jgi:His-Xaa-Ser system radical SAM maturase HxsC